MDNKLNLGPEIRELKLGSSFINPSSSARNNFHTLKYDFKPASVDPNKAATLDVSTNNQVTVNVPHLNGSGVPQTVFKGNQRNYTKECVLIIDKVTGEITLVKLHHNIQVKKTRSESTSKPSAIMPPQKISENLTQRTQSKTKVSTGVRKNPIINNTSQRHSPLPGSPSNRQNKSPLQQNAPIWHANNVQSTLPSIPLIGLDDDPLPSSSSSSSAMTGNNIPIEMNILQPLSLSQQTNSMGSIPVENNEPISFHNDIGVLSSSDSSSDSESSESGSDSDSSANNTPSKPQNQNAGHNGSLPTHLLTEDLCLSESNSDDDD